MRTRTLPLALMALLLTAANGAWAVPMLDQSSEGGLSQGSVGHIDAGQTFTVGAEGRLVEVQAEVRRFDAAALDLTIDVRRTVAGAPVEDDVLASITIPASSIGMTAPAYLSFDLRSFDIRVEVGDELAIVLSTVASQTTYVWLERTDDSYAGGQRFLRGAFAGSTWNGAGFGSPVTDLNFRTFVAPVPEPGTGLLLWGGLLACAVRGGLRPEKPTRPRPGKLQ